MFAKLPGCRPRSKVVKAVGDGVGIGVGGFVGGHGEKLWVEFSRGCRWSSEEDQLPRSFLVLLLLQLPLLQGRWERGVEEGVANRYGRGRVCGSGRGSHRGRLVLFGSWVSLFNGLWSHACSASATFIIIHKVRSIINRVAARALVKQSASSTSPGTCFNAMPP